MKQLVLVAVLAALASSALTLLLASRLAPAPARSPTPTTAPMQPGLAEIAQELAAIRRDLAAARGSAEATPAPVGTAAAVPGPIGAPSSAVPAAGPAAPVASPDRDTRIVGVLDMEAVSERHGGMSVDARMRWMLRGERELTEWLGPPDSVIVSENGVETWRYDIPEAARVEGRWTHIRFQIHDGRVIDGY